MAFCSSCGIANTNDAKFCTNCGVSIPLNAKISQPEPIAISAAKAEVTNLNVIGPSESDVEKQTLGELWKLYIFISITGFLAFGLTSYRQIFLDIDQPNWALVLVFSIAIWFPIAFSCLKIMAINKRRPKWALGYLMFNVATLIWYTTTTDGGFERLILLPEVISQLPGSALGKGAAAAAIIWSEFLSNVFAIVVIYKIFIVVKSSKEK